MKIVRAVSGIPIRMTPERWDHIASRHAEMATEEERVLETIVGPDCVPDGDHGTLMAVKHYLRTPVTTKHCVVVYREVGTDDGFVVTAYFTSATSPVRRIA